MKIVFFGTPDFAAESLDALVLGGQEVVGVVTAPDKPAGRGHGLRQSAVKESALKHKLPLLQPKNLKNEDFLSDLAAWGADLFVVVAFRMLPEAVWNMPEKGTFNLHASLLPQYRGAAPINWAIINGEEETGLTTFFLKHEIDTGDLIFQEREAILPTDNVGTLYERLKNKGAQLTLKTAEAIAKNEAPRLSQNESITIKHAPKIFQETCDVNFAQSPTAVWNFVRGLSPYPAARFMLDGKRCKLFDVTPHEAPDAYPSLALGDYATDGKTFLHVKTEGGYVAINELQVPNKKRLTTEVFLRGAKLANHQD